MASSNASNWKCGENGISSNAYTIVVPSSLPTTIDWPQFVKWQIVNSTSVVSVVVSALVVEVGVVVVVVKYPSLSLMVSLKRWMATGCRQFVFKSHIFSADGVVQTIIVEWVGHHDAHLIGSKPLSNSIIGSSIFSIQIRIYLKKKSS